MTLSRVAFHHAFKRFQSIHRREDRRPLDSFRNPQTYAWRAEDYKEQVARQAQTILDAKQWHERSIGRGQILRQVITAIEQPGNNLLQWDNRFGPNHRVHLRLYDALKKHGARREIEKVFFDLYARRKATGDQFEHLAWLCGKRYELIAYLFFIADRHRFLPIRTTSFDLALSELGLTLRTARQCSWQNYEEFLNVMSDVREALRYEGIVEPSLLDAHSFCWLLATYGRRGDRRLPPRIRSHMEVFTGLIVAPATDDERAADASGRDSVVDMQAVALRRAEKGQVAEEIALQEERRRLIQLKRRDLAENVELVSDRPGLGYDIKSFERTGDPRHIEVKNLGDAGEFHLSDNQWARCRALPNYWFYLVMSSDARRPRVVQLPASQLERRHLSPTQYAVRVQVDP